MKKLRTIAVILVIFGGLLTFFGIALAAMSMYNSLSSPSFVGIIGGVDAPTVWFYFTRGFEKYLPITATGLASIALSVVLFIVSRKRK